MIFNLIYPCDCVLHSLVENQIMLLKVTLFKNAFVDNIIVISSNAIYLFIHIAAKAKGTHLRIHFKHTREIGEAIKGKTIAKATAYLKDVLAFKEAIPFTKYTGGIGRHAIAKKYKVPGDKVGWPIKATKTFLDLLLNIESNATVS